MERDALAMEAWARVGEAIRRYLEENPDVQG